MTAFAYYNEFDPKAAIWLRELIKCGALPQGDVDDRSITEVCPGDLAGYTQCHFFAGIGGWAYALKLAGWPEDTPVWTGSCPCQPFSVAGERKGFKDNRHLWPEFFRLIQGVFPEHVFGEQVSGPAGFTWLDLVLSDLENAGYTGGALDLCAASAGAPHIRQRLYWCADRQGVGMEDAGGVGRHVRSDGQNQEDGGTVQAPGRRGTERMVVPDGGGLVQRSQGDDDQGTGSVPPEGQRSSVGMGDRDDTVAGTCQQAVVSECAGELRGMVNSACAGCFGGSEQWKDVIFVGEGGTGRMADADCQRLTGCGAEQSAHEGVVEEDSLADYWRNVRWCYCRDEKWRPFEFPIFPLADGVPGRVGLLRGYGNAIVPQVAAGFIKAYMRVRGMQ